MNSKLVELYRTKKSKRLLHTQFCTNPIDSIANQQPSSASAPAANDQAPLKLMKEQPSLSQMPPSFGTLFLIGVIVVAMDAA